MDKMRQSNYVTILIKCDISLFLKILSSLYIHDWTILMWIAYTFNNVSIWWNRNCKTDTFSSWRNSNAEIMWSLNSIIHKWSLALYEKKELIRRWSKSSLWYSVLRVKLVSQLLILCLSRYKAQCYKITKNAELKTRKTCTCSF